MVGSPRGSRKRHDQVRSGCSSVHALVRSCSLFAEPIVRPIFVPGPWLKRCFIGQTPHSTARCAQKGRTCGISFDIVQLTTQKAQLVQLIQQERIDGTSVFTGIGRGLARPADGGRRPCRLEEAPVQGSLASKALGISAGPLLGLPVSALCQDGRSDRCRTAQEGGGGKGLACWRCGRSSITVQRHGRGKHRGRSA